MSELIQEHFQPILLCAFCIVFTWSIATTIWLVDYWCNFRRMEKSRDQVVKQMIGMSSQLLETSRAVSNRASTD